MEANPGLESRSAAADTVAGLNEIVRSGKIKALVEESLAIYEKSLDEAAAKVMAPLNAGDKLRMMWVSGPSSSGKTTTTVKLTERLQKQGLRFLMLNLDDYFWSLVEHPTDWINDRNYETPEALDIQLLNQHLVRRCSNGETIEKPVYSFKEGRRTASKPVKLEKDQILLLDCLHGLYPPITEGIDDFRAIPLYIETQNVMYEGDGSTKRLDQVHRCPARPPHAARRPHRNHSPLLTVVALALRARRRTVQHHSAERPADHAVNGGFPFDLPALQPFFSGASGYLPAAEDFGPYAGFLDAHIRYERVKDLARIRRRPDKRPSHQLRHHSQRRRRPRIRRRQHREDSA